MLTETEKRDFLFSTIRPMADFTLRYLTQVIGVEDDRTGEHRGTGFFCCLGGRQAVVTAAHVLREAAATGRYSSLTFARGMDQSPAIVAGTIRYFDEIDIAVYLPSREFPLGQDKDFWPEDQIEPSIVPAKTDYLFVQGFPVRFARRSGLAGGLVSETLSSGAMMRLDSLESPEISPGQDLLPEGLLKDHQFAFDFDFNPENFEGPDGVTLPGDTEHWRELFVPSEGETFPGQRPRGAYGLSGSPVWRIGAPDQPSRDWSPSAARLIGIVTDWNPDQKILIATSTAELIAVSSEF